MLMTDEWFDEYTYEVVIDKKYLGKKVLDIFDRKPVKNKIERSGQRSLEKEQSSQNIPKI